ncbi:hypothetical protein [Streptomyces hirsutus]
MTEPHPGLANYSGSFADYLARLEAARNPPPPPEDDDGEEPDE